MRALDVGAGTGIASAQLIEAGAEVLAVEDVIADDYPMTPLDVGDVVVTPLMGAYTIAPSCRRGVIGGLRREAIERGGAASICQGQSLR